MSPSLASEIAPYLVSVVGVLLIYVLNGIKSEIRDIKGSLNVLEGDLRSGIASLDRRITVMETKCVAEHGHLQVGER